MQRIILLLALLAVTGCVTTAQELINTSENKKTISLDQNYQAVYRDVLTVARNCEAGPVNLVVSNRVDGQLYNELGYAEISFYQANLRPLHLVYLKIAKVGNGSEVMIYASHRNYLRIFEEYVRGKKDC